jgi:hypothetical protein
MNNYVFANVKTYLNEKAVVCGGKGGSYTVLMWKPEGKRPLK